MQVVSLGHGGKSQFSASNKSYKVLPIIELFFHLCCLHDLQLYTLLLLPLHPLKGSAEGPGAKHTPWLPLCVCVCLCLTCQMMVDIRIHNEDGGCLPGDELVQELLTCISKQQLGRCHDVSDLSHFMNW